MITHLIQECKRFLRVPNQTLRHVMPRSFFSFSLSTSAYSALSLCNYRGGYSGTAVQWCFLFAAVTYVGVRLLIPPY
jgi:hypothetical protein